jgi:hypothetical protein
MTVLRLQRASVFVPGNTMVDCVGRFPCRICRTIRANASFNPLEAVQGMMMPSDRVPIQTMMSLEMLSQTIHSIEATV